MQSDTDIDTVYDSDMHCMLQHIGSNGSKPKQPNSVDPKEEKQGQFGLVL